jgi:class 3 adenylate cyclase
MRQDAMPWSSGSDPEGTLDRRRLTTAISAGLSQSRRLAGILSWSLVQDHRRWLLGGVYQLRRGVALRSVECQPDGLRLRIGVHQGEVVAEGDDLVGDGVIMMSALTPSASPTRSS